MSGLLLASNASADVDTSAYPEDIQALLTEAKQLGLEIVQEPQSTITTSQDARTYLLLVQHVMPYNGSNSIPKF